MPYPHLTFFCELDTPELPALFREAVLADLQELKATVSLGLRDLSPERANVVRSLNAAGIPIIAWLLLPREQGYWFNADNVEHAASCYRAFRYWTVANQLKWVGVGFDIEPDIREMEKWVTNSASSSGKLKVATDQLQLAGRRRWKAAQAAYKELAREVRSDGFYLESYQLPLLLDERKARSRLLQRLLGLVDIPADREVWMLYTSNFRPRSVGILGSYGPEAQAIALGSTGGGVEGVSPNGTPLSWDELALDLRQAYYWTDYIYIFSLEGCVRQGFLGQLKDFAWDNPIILPENAMEWVNGWRGTLQAFLWVGSHIPILAGIGVSSGLLALAMRRWWRRRSP